MSERTMRVLVSFTVDTSDYGEKEFRKEVENLITDIDSNSRLIDFAMGHVDSNYKLTTKRFSNFCIASDPSNSIKG